MCNNPVTLTAIKALIFCLVAQKRGRRQGSVSLRKHGRNTNVLKPKAKVLLGGGCGWVDDVVKPDHPVSVPKERQQRASFRLNGDSVERDHQ